MKKPKIDSEERDKKIEALISLQNHWGWKTFIEMIQYFQGLYSSKLFTKKFMNLDPVEKDREHRAIVAVLNVLEKLLGLPQWLKKTDPKRWDEVTQKLMEDLQNGR